MCRLFPALLLCLTLYSPGRAQDKTPLLDGLKVAKVPDVLYAQVPALPAGKGLLVLEVVPGSSADKAGLRRHDILLSLGKKPLDGSGGLPARAGQKEPLVLIRGGRIVPIAAARLFQAAYPPGPTAMLKPGGPPAVTVEAKPLQGNLMSVTFTYFANKTGKLEQVQCSGSVDEIKHTVKDLVRKNSMSSQVQDLADLALERIRVLNSSSKK